MPVPLPGVAHLRDPLGVVALPGEAEPAGDVADRLRDADEGDVELRFGRGQRRVVAVGVDLRPPGCRSPAEGTGRQRVAVLEGIEAAGAAVVVGPEVERQFGRPAAAIRVVDDVRGGEDVVAAHHRARALGIGPVGPGDEDDAAFRVRVLETLGGGYFDNRHAVRLRKARARLPTGGLRG